jgi:tetratricopeptide (TPR) repeat protein
MSSPRHSRPLALLLSLLPGLGQVYLGRDLAFLVYFSLEALCLFAALNAVLLYQGPERPRLVQGALAAAGVVWLAGIWDVLRRTAPSRLKRIEGEKARLLRDGMIAYLREDLAGAETLFRACLALDGEEVEALFRLGVLLRRQGDVRGARRSLRRARKLDLEEKWRWEIDRELRAGKSGTKRIAAAEPREPPRPPPARREGEEENASGEGESEAQPAPELQA